MAKTKPINTDAISDGTARSWDQWLAFLADIGAPQMSHPEIARLVQETGDASGWWSQSITVAYEQHIGRRQPGQRSSGQFEVSVTRTMPGQRAALFKRLCSLLDACLEFDGIAVSNASRTSVTPKRSYWRRKLADGSGVAFALEQKAPDKVLVAVTHDRLPSAEAAARWREAWKATLANF